MLQGIENPEKQREDFWNTINGNKVNVNILKDENVYVVEENGINLIVIYVPRAEFNMRPVYVGENPYKGTYNRNHEGDYHATEHEIRGMIRDQNPEGNDSLILEYYTMDDIDKETLRKYRRIFEIRNEGHVWNPLDDKTFLEKLGGFGRGTKKTLQKIKNGFKYSAISNVIFEDLGFTYIGIIDGHNLESVINALSRAKEIDGPVIIHAFTKKGMGYDKAEKEPSLFHGVKGEIKDEKNTGMSYSSKAGDILCDIAEKNENVVAITAAMTSGCGLAKFSEKYPKRFFDVGIAEEHAVTMAAGMAIGKTVPVVCIYSTFLQRAYDQIIHDVAISNLHIVFCIDRSGIVGDDGETHHGIFDISYLSHIPNMTILSPTCEEELEKMLNYAVNELDGPVAIRYPRGEIIQYDGCKEFEMGKSSVVKKGKDVTIVSVGNMLKISLEVLDILEENGITATLINALCICPCDIDTIRENTDNFLFTIEDNVLSGGYGQKVSAMIGKNVMVKNYAWPDKFVTHGRVDLLYKEASLDAKSIAKDILKTVKGEV